MKHYSTTDLKIIKDDLTAKSLILSTSLNWTEEHLKYEEKNNLLLKIKNAQNIFNKVSKNIESKPVIAVFGGSQVGKSYLIKNLLSLKGKPFLIKNQNKVFDFLKDINPPGVGAESTGVVTRFTIDNEIKFDAFPIKVKLLSPKDILTILLDSFFLDLKKITYFINAKDLELHINNFESKIITTNQNILTEFDILEIKSYFENHLSKHTILFEGLNETRFFERIGKIISFFEYKEWGSIFNILWNRNSYLSFLFDKLVSGLSSIQFDETIYIGFEEVLRGHGEILDVKRLKELNTSNKSIVIKKENGSEISLNLSLITSLTAELVFTIPEELVETKVFLKNSDLLDFPGARSRLALELDDINTEIIPEMLLRGKVSYLFNKYSDDFNINNLMFCTNDKQLDVNEIPSLLFNWISKNIGTSSQERNNSLIKSDIPPLFVIFTFFNNQLKYDTTNDFNHKENYKNLNYKWDTRFKRFFENEIVTQTKEWHIDWTKENPTFTNFYLLRDFKYSTDVFSGYEETEIETEVRNDRMAFLDSLKQSFLNFDFIQKHFDNPKNVWENVATKNNDGSEIIINNLKEVSNNFSKINHYLNKIKNITEEVIAELNKHIHSDDLSTIRANCMKNVNEMQFSLNSAITKDVDSYNNLIKTISIEPIEIYNLFNENIVTNVNQKNTEAIDQNHILFSQYPELKNITNYKEAIKILKQNLWLTNDEEVEAFLNEKGIRKETLFVEMETKSKSQFYTQLVINYWISKISVLENYNMLYSNGLTKNSISFLIDHFKKIIKNRNLENKIEMILNEVISETETNRGIEEFLAETTCLLINDIIINFDLNYFLKEEIIELNNLKIASNFKFYNTTPDKNTINLERIFNGDDSSNSTLIVLDKYNKWIEYFRISLLVNCGFVNYNEFANNQLKSIIADFKKQNLIN